MTVIRRTNVLEQPLPGAPPRPRAPVPERWTLGNGLRVAAVRRPALPQVALRVVLPAGASADPVGAEGLASLAGSLVTEGTERFGSEELNRRLDLLGSSLSVQAGHDFTELDLHLLSETLPEGLELLAEVLMRPVFPQEEVERVRAETLDALEARLDELANVADDRLAEALFGETHPYGRLPLGTFAGVEAIRREQIVELHARHYRPDGAVLVIAGDLDVEETKDLLEQALGGWLGAAERAALAMGEATGPATGTAEYFGWPGAMQSELRLGGRGMQRSSPDWIPGAVANYLLGGSTITGRLGANLREEKGWTYGVRSGFSASLRPGAWGIETAVDAEMTDRAFEEIRKELIRFLAEPVSADELRRAKDALILSLPRAFETPGRIVSRMAAVEIFGLAADYWITFPDRVEEVTREEVLRIAHGYFDPARLHALAVGPERSGG